MKYINRNTKQINVTNNMYIPIVTLVEKGASDLNLKVL